jgi:hypothetical protein
MSKKKKQSSHLGQYAALPHHYYTTPEYRALSLGARALVVEFALRYNGRNNGNLEMTETQAKQAGIGSPKTFRKYRDELIAAGWIVVTRLGGLERRCTLYALTYFPIDATNVSYDTGHKADTMPLHLWRSEKAEWREPRHGPAGRSRLDTLARARPS